MADGNFVNKKIKQKTIVAADFWCGAGGTSTGLVDAINELGWNLELTAVNHWEIAVATHSKNHPDARHFCKSVDSLSPLELFPKRRIKLLLASPECVHHSKARGGKPRDEQRRADAWDIQRWVEKLFIENLIIENVEEFTDWGPLDAKGQPIKSKKGVYFKRFVDFLEELYTVEWRILNCADYGDATTRKRFFLLAKRGKNKKIFFPPPTHASRKILESKQPDLFNPDELQPWVSAREIINWNLKGKNVFGRKKPLSDNTMRRIYAGSRKYSGIDIPERQIFVVKSLVDLLDKKKKNKPEKLNKWEFEKQLKKQPEIIVPDWEIIERNEKSEIIRHEQFPSVSELEALRELKQKEADHIYQTSPIKIDLSKFKGFTMGTGGPTGQQRPRDIDEPVRTILTDHRQNVFEPKLEPFLFNNSGTERRDRSIEEPTFTQRTGRTQGVATPKIEPFIINQKGTTQRMREIGEPTFTQTANSVGQYVCQPYMVNLSHTQNNDEGMCKELQNPLPVICGKGMLGVVEPFFVAFHGGQKDGGVNRSHDIEKPVPTLDTSNRFGVVEAFLVPTNHGKNDDRAHSLEDPTKTITGVDAMGIAEPCLIKYHGNEKDAHSTNEPLSTITTKDRLGLAEPFLAQYFGGATAVSIDEPCPTITANYEHYAVVTPFAVKFNNNEDAKDLNEPVPTITTREKIGIGQPFMIQFFGERDGQNPRTREVDSPIWTVTPQIRQGIVEPFLVKLEDCKGKAIHGLLLLELGAILVINFRMLHQTELAAAMSFPPDYYFHGTRDEQVKQIGNAVPRKTAKALCLAQLQGGKKCE